MQPSQYPICRHTKTDGRRCQSAALSTSAFCYHHQRLRRTHPHAAGAGAAALGTHVFHSLQSRAAIQYALSLVYSGVRHDLVTNAQAKKMLRVIRMAQTNLSRT